MKRWMIVCAILVVGVVQVQGSLVHRYAMNDPNDTMGTANATLVIRSPGTVGFQDGQLMMGNAGQTSDSGSGNYLELPNGTIKALGTAATFETWTTWTSGGMWARIFDFGTSNCGENSSCGADAAQYFFLTPNGGNTPMRFGMNMPTPTRVENVMDSSAGILTQNIEHHIVVTYDEATAVTRMYLNGAQVAQGVVPGGFTMAGMNDNNIWLGRAQWNDPMYGGSFNEFRIYNHAMNASEVTASLAAGTEVSIATPIYPADGQKEVARIPTLQWAAGVMPADYTNKAFRIYLSKTQDDVANGAAGALLVDGNATTSFVVPAAKQLDTDTTYYWRIDESFIKPGSSEPNYANGAVYSFDSIKTYAILTGIKGSALVGKTVKLTMNIVSVSPISSINWFKYVDGTNDTPVVSGGRFSIADSSTASVLTVSATEMADDGLYYCTVTNNAGAAKSANLKMDIQQGLIHRYSFTADPNDSIGTADGTLMGNAKVEGGQAMFDGVAGSYINLPPRMVGGLNSVTFMFWMKADALAWSRVFDFGKTSAPNGVNYFFWAPSTAGRFAIKDAGTEQAVDGGNPGVSTMINVTCVYDADSAATPTMKIYYNGAYKTQRLNCFPITVVDDIECWLGRSHYTTDPYFTGAIDEFRIFDTPLNAGWVKAYYDAGPDALATDACVAKPAYDFSGDCKVTLEDFAMFAQTWLACGLDSCQ